MEVLLRFPSNVARTVKVTAFSDSIETPYTALLDQPEAGVVPGDAKRAGYSWDGSRLFVQRESGAVVVATQPPLAPLAPLAPPAEGAATGAAAERVVATTHEGLSAAYVELSPRGTYLSAWSRPDVLVVLPSDEPGAAPLLKLQAKKQNSAVQWTHDERFVAHLLGASAVQVFTTAQKQDNGFLAEAFRVKLDNVTLFSLCPTPLPDHDARVVAFELGAKGGKPSAVSLHAAAAQRRLANGATFRAEEASFRWSPKGNAVLCKVESAVDATGQSYYGESKLILLLESPPDKNSDTAVTVHPPKEGAIHDVQWSPLGDVFCVAAGRSPPRCTLFDAKGVAVYEFGENYRNTISFNPFGRFLCLAGFGNLPGDMDFWDVPKRKRMGTCKADSPVSYGWSPDGRLFLTATLTPRMNVDNGFAVYTYRGQRIGAWKAPQLSPGGKDALMQECSWRPAPPGAFPDRLQSPQRGRGKEPAPGDVPAAAAAGAGGAAAAAASKGAAPAGGGDKVFKPAGVYRPPHASGKVAEMMRGERVQAGALNKPGAGAAAPQASAAKPAERYVPGFELAAPPKSKNKKKSKKKAGAGAADGAGDAEDADDGEDAGEEEPQKAGGAAAAAPPVASAPAPASGAADGEEGGGADDTPERVLERQLRKWSKLLKQINEIQAKGPKDDEQRAKLQRRGEVEAQVQTLTAEMAKLKVQAP